MRVVTMSPKQLSANLASLEQVVLSFDKCGKYWHAWLWIVTDDGHKSGFVLSSDRQPEKHRLFSTIDAAVNALYAAGVRDITFTK